MKPKSLVVEGLFSFLTKQEIDFTLLTKDGIFGIFGDTGSGKSAVLDSMVFALYGDTGRGDNHQILNLQSNLAFCEFTFSMQNFNRSKTYSISRTLKLKKDGSAEQSACAYEILHNEKQLITEGAVRVNKFTEELIGLNIKEFKKCIAIPQGEFANFLRATHSEQSQIMGHLFSLEIYGDILNRKLNIYIDSIELEKSNIEGKLSVYADINKDKKDELKKSLKAIESNLKTLKSEFNNYKEKNSKFEKYLEILNKLNFECEELKKLNALKPDIDLKVIEVQKIKSAIQIYPQIKNVDDLLKQQNKAQGKKITLERVFNDAKKELENFLKIFESRKEKAEKEIADVIFVLNNIEPLNLEQQKLNRNLNRMKELKNEYKKNFSKIKEDQKILDDLLIQEKISDQKLILEKNALNKLDTEIFTLVKVQDVRISSAKGEIFFGANKHFNDGLNSAKNEFENVDMHFKALKGYLDSGLRKTTQYESLKADACPKFDLSELLFNKDKLQNNVDSILDKQKNSDAKKSELKIEIAKNKQVLLSIESEGKSLNVQIEESKAIFKNASLDSESDFLKLSEEKKLLMENLKFSLNMLEQEKNNLSEKFKNSELEYAKSLESYRIITNNKERAEIDGLKILKEFNFKDFLQVNYFYLQKENLQVLEKQILKFDEDYKKSNITEKALKEEIEILDLKDIDETVSVHYKKIEEDLEAAQKQKGDLEGQVKSFIAKEKELIVLNKEYAINCRKSETADKLRKGIKNKALMDFAVKEYFIDICDAASEKLSYLSDGKFELVFDNGFFIKDNLNGGKQRDVCTLSGGETFLVSLSLAVSLSEAIVSMSNKPIEFFFLDEGFGTLDENLVDTVMTALEKLTKTHFCIGLISHVSELKTRILNKLVLEKTNGATKILANIAY